MSRSYSPFLSTFAEEMSRISVLFRELRYLGTDPLSLVRRRAICTEESGLGTVVMAHGRKSVCASTVTLIV